MIPVRDRPDDLAATLATIGDVGAVVVVDDGSEGEAVAQVAHRYPTTYLRHDTRTGPAAARNTGWRATTTTLVAFVDADCEPQPAWLDRLLPHFGDPEVAAVAPRITSRVPSTLPDVLARYENAVPSLDRGPEEASRTTPQSSAVRPDCRVGRSTRGIRRARRLRRGIASRRGRRLRLAAARGGPVGSLRAFRLRVPRRAPDGSGMAPPALRLRHICGGAGAASWSGRRAAGRVAVERSGVDTRGPGRARHGRRGRGRDDRAARTAARRSRPSVEGSGAARGEGTPLCGTGGRGCGPAPVVARRRCGRARVTPRARRRGGRGDDPGTGSSGDGCAQPSIP